MSVEDGGFSCSPHDGWIDDHLVEAAGAVLGMNALRGEVESEDRG